MDASGRLAQSRKPGYRVAAARWLQARAVSAPRWRRHALRLSAAALRYHAPKGVGASAAALLLLGSVCYGVARGDRLAVMAANLQDMCDSAANAAGFGITEVALAGEHNLGRKAILHAAGITGRTSLLFLDAHAARNRQMKNPWVAEATVLKL
jgi:cell division protein FtsQ